MPLMLLLLLHQNFQGEARQTPSRPCCRQRSVARYKPHFDLITTFFPLR